jgi:hypothetical protein
MSRVTRISPPEQDNIELGFAWCSLMESGIRLQVEHRSREMPLPVPER